MKEIQPSRVFMIPDNIFNDGQKLNVIKLKHPKTDSSMSCALGSDGSLYEIVNVTSKFCSWILEDSVIEDGGLYILTVFDPLYIVLPYLSKMDKFCQLEDILVDEIYPDNRYLFESVTSEDLSQISEAKVISELQLYRYNESKTLKWLQQKVTLVSVILKEKRIDISDGSKADILTNENGYSEEAYIQHACKLISEYLPATFSQKLHEALGLSMESELTSSNESNGENNPPAKKKKIQDVKPADDYGKFFSPDSAKKSGPKLTSSQKQLMKVDKTGMKSISSFFSKK